MQSVILAAGRGTRMGELTNAVPKPMLCVFGKPLLEYHLSFLPDEVDEVIFVIGYLGEQIKEYFGDEWKGRRIRYVVQEKLDGTAGAIHLVKEMVHDRFLVTMGDDFYTPEDLRKLSRHPLALLAYRTQSAASFGIVTVDDHSRLLGVVERPHGFSEGLVNTGAYILNTDFFRYDPVKISETEFGLPQTLVVMSADSPVSVEMTEQWVPIGNPNDFAPAEQFLSSLGIQE